MSKDVKPSPRASQPDPADEPTPSQLSRRRLGLLAAALAVTGVSGCVVVPARAPRARVRVIV